MLVKELDTEVRETARELRLLRVKCAEDLHCVAGRRVLDSHSALGKALRVQSEPKVSRPSSHAGTRVRRRVSAFAILLCLPLTICVAGLTGRSSTETQPSEPSKSDLAEELLTADVKRSPAPTLWARAHRIVALHGHTATADAQYCLARPRMANCCGL